MVKDGYPSFTPYIRGDFLWVFPFASGGGKAELREEKGMDSRGAPTAGRTGPSNTKELLLQTASALTDSCVFWYRPGEDLPAELPERLAPQEGEAHILWDARAMEALQALLNGLPPPPSQGRRLLQVRQGQTSGAWAEVRYVTLEDGILAAVKGLTQEQEQDLLRQSQLDHVTGLYHREAFIQLLAQRTAGPEGNGALVLARINHLDQVNDQLGSRQGDLVLRDLTRTLQALLHSRELAGRCGAEFFLYLNPAPTRELLEERLRILCAALHRKLDEGITITANLGVLDGLEQGFRYDELYEKVRLALRSSAQRGEGTFEIYRPELQPPPEPVRAPLPEGPSARDSRIFVRTFGYFDVFVDGNPIHFQGGQAKELMALLVDRRGGFLNSSEAIACLWENEPANKTTFARFRKVAMRLKRSLEEAGAADILESRGGERRVIPEKFRCDYYEYLDGGRGERAAPTAYMTNYSWAESTLADLIGTE